MAGVASATEPPPVNTGPPVISGSAQDGHTLTTTNGSWSSPDPLTFHYQWQRCDATGANCVNITSATASSYKLTPADVSHHIDVVVTAIDHEGQFGHATAGMVGPIGNPPPPASTKLPVISGTVQAGQTLSATNGTWASPDKLAYTYQWERCDDLGANCAPIVGATRSAYQLIVADVKNDVTIVVTATDQENQPGTAAAAPVGPVAPYVNWPGYLFNLGHSSLNSLAMAITPTRAAGLAAAWATPFKPTGGFYGSPTVYNGDVYIGGRNGVFYQLSETTGAVLHSVDLGTEHACTQVSASWGTASTATVAPDPGRGGALTVYVTAGNGSTGTGGSYLWALDAVDLHPVWATDPVAVDQQTGSYAWSSPTVSGGHVSAGISSGCDAPLVRGGLGVFKQSDGSRVGTYYTVPAGSVGGTIWSTAASSGTTSWVTTGNADQTPGATAGDSFSIVRLTGVSKSDIWTVPSQVGTDNDWGSSPTLFNGLLNAVSTPLVGACLKSGTFYALERQALSSGPVWSFQVASPTDTLSCLSAAVWDSTADQLIIGGNATASPIDGQQWPGSIQALSPDASPANRVMWDRGLPCAVEGTPTENAAGVLAVVTWDRCTTGSSPSLYLFNARATSPNASGHPDPQLLKTIPLGSSGFSQPTFADSYLFVASNGGGLMAYH